MAEAATTDGQEPEVTHKVEVTEISKNSHILLESVDFSWTITRFDTICTETTTTFQSIRSPVISVNQGPSKTSASFTAAPDKQNSPSVWFFELRCHNGYLSLFLCSEEKRPFVSEEEKNRLADVFCHFQVISPNDAVALQGDGAQCRPTADETYAIVKEFQNVWKNSVSPDPEASEHLEWPNFLHVSDLYAKKPQFLQDNGSLRLHMDLKIPRIVHTDTDDRTPIEVYQNLASEAIGQTEEVAKTSLAQDMASLFLSLEHSDFTITCGNASYPVHKPVILGRCKKFYKMLMTQVNSKQTRILQNTDPVFESYTAIHDVEPEVVKAFLEFLYKGSFSFPISISNVSIADSKDSSNSISSNQTNSNNENSVKESNLTGVKLLLKEAIKYEMEEMKQSCFVKMIEMLDLENVAQIILLSETHSADEQIREYIHKFCDKHRADLVDNEHFRSYRNEHPSAFKFFDYLETKMNEQKEVEQVQEE